MYYDLSDKLKKGPFMQIPRITSIVCILILLCLSLSQADIFIDTIPLNTPPGIANIAVNPMTNKIYVTNPKDSNLIVIDGKTKSQKIIPILPNAKAIGINHITNQVMVACSTGYNTAGFLFIIDGATEELTKMTVGKNPRDIIVNPITNQIFVVNNENNYNGPSTITQLDGTTYERTDIPLAAEPLTGSLNPLTNKLYLADQESFNHALMEVDLTNNQIDTIEVHELPAYLSVNPVTNMIYVPCDGAFRIVDGSNKVSSAIGVMGRGDDKVTAVNPATNRVFRGTDRGAGVYNPATSKTISVKAKWVNSIVANAATNKAYFSGRNVTILDGKNNDSSYTQFTVETRDVAVNPITNKIYFVSNDHFNPAIYVMDGSSNESCSPVKSRKEFQIIKDPLSNYIYQFFTNESYMIKTDILSGNSTRINTNTILKVCRINPITKTLCNAKDSTLEIIDLTTGKIKATIQTDYPTHTFEVNPFTNSAYAIGKHTADSSYIIKMNLESFSKTVTLLPGSLNHLKADEQSCKLFAILKNRDPEQNDTLMEIDGNNLSLVRTPLVAKVSSFEINPVNNSITFIQWSGSLILTYHRDSGEQTKAFTTTHISAASGSNKISGELYIIQDDVTNAYDSALVTIIDTTGAVDSKIAIAPFPRHITVNPITNKIYISHSNVRNDSSTITVIDIASKHRSTFKAYKEQTFLEIDPVHNVLYSVNEDNTLYKTVVSPQYQTKLATNLSLATNVVMVPKPTLSGTIVDGLVTTPTTASRVLCKKYTHSSTWNTVEMNESSGTEWQWEWGSDTLQFGLNYIQAVPLNALSSSINMCGRSSLFTGNSTIIPLFRIADNEVSTMPQKSSNALTQHMAIRDNVLHFNVTQKSNVTINIINLRGQLISTLMNTTQYAGDHNISLDKLSLSKGLYFITYADKSNREILKYIAK